MSSDIVADTLFESSKLLSYIKESEEIECEIIKELETVESAFSSQVESGSDAFYRVMNEESKERVKKLSAYKGRLTEIVGRLSAFKAMRHGSDS